MKSPLSDVHIPRDAGVAQYLMTAMAQHGHNVALIDSATGQQTSYITLVRQITSVARSLHRRGLKSGDVLMLCLPNCAEFPVTLLATLALGGIVCPVNPANNIVGIQRQMVDTNPKYIITSSGDALVKMIAALQTCPVYESIKEIFTTGANPAPGGCTALHDLYDDPVTSGSDPVTSDSDPVTSGSDPTTSDSDPMTLPIDAVHQVALYPYSSGTSGRLKGVRISHYNLLANLCQFSHPSLQHAGHQTVLSVVPLFHMYGLNVVLLHSLLRGDTVVMYPKYSLHTLLDAASKYKVTTLYLVPPVALELTKSPLLESVDRDLSCLRGLFSGAAPIGAEVCRELIQRLRLDYVEQGYGMTECSPGATHPIPNSGKPTSVGVPLPNTQVQVVCPSSGLPLGPLQRGELWVRGPQVMLGYLGNDRATRETVDSQGWLHTGDLGMYDKDGYFYIQDRLKELIKYKGYQVPPAELEAVLLTHPGVRDAAVIGVPDPGAGELPRAYVVRKPGVAMTEGDVVLYVKARVIHYMQLRGGVNFVQEIPKSPSGKILRRLLREGATRTMAKL